MFTSDIIVSTYNLTIALPQPNQTLTHNPPLPQPNLNLNFWLGVIYYALSLPSLPSLSRLSLPSRKLAIYSKTSKVMLILTLTLLIARFKFTNHLNLNLSLNLYLNININLNLNLNVNLNLNRSISINVYSNFTNTRILSLPKK